MRINFKEMKDVYKDLNIDMWIIAPGPSMNYVKPEFFNNKITMGINETFTKFKNCVYYLRKDGRCWQGRDVIEHIKNVSPKSKLIVSDYQGCAYEWGHNDFDTDLDYYYFEHPASHGEITEGILDNMEGQFCNGIGIVGIAIHLSVFMGFKNIIICGNDNVFFDDKDYFDNYCDTYECPTGHTATIRWAGGQAEEVARHFRSKGINIHGFNPWINFLLENHIYSRTIRDEK